MSNSKKPKLPSKQSEEFSRARRRAEVAELYLKGMTQVMIAEEVGVSSTTVGADLKKIMEEWVKSAQLAFEERKAQELAKIDQIERLAYRGWEASLERQEVHRSLKETVRQAQRDGENKVIGHKMVPVKVIEEVVVKGQSGDPRFLEQAARCVEMRLRILGLWKGDTNVQNQITLDWSGLFKAQAERARQQAEEQERAKLGYGRGAPELLPVRAHTVIDQNNEAPGPEPLPLPEDPIEARISQEERSNGIQLRPS